MVSWVGVLNPSDEVPISRSRPWSKVKKLQKGKVACGDNFAEDRRFKQTSYIRRNSYTFRRTGRPAATKDSVVDS